MPHWRTLRRPSETLRAYDLVDNNMRPRDFTLKIERVVQGTVKSAENPNGDPMPFIYFEGAKKPLGANVTNCEVIESITGSDDYAKWPGHSITLYTTKHKGKSGKVVPCIRIRPRKPTTTAETLPDVPVDEEMIARQQNAAREPGED